MKTYLNRRDVKTWDAGACMVEATVSFTSKGITGTEITILKTPAYLGLTREGALSLARALTDAANWIKDWKP